MTPQRPYILRALYEWIIDNNCTPYVLVNAEAPNVDVPKEYIDNGQMVLDISPSAVPDLLIDNNALRCTGRFAGVFRKVDVAIPGVLGIYAKENGEGKMFDDDDRDRDPPPPPPKRGGRPALKVVK